MEQANNSVNLKVMGYNSASKSGKTKLCLWGIENKIVIGGHVRIIMVLIHTSSVFEPLYRVR